MATALTAPATNPVRPNLFKHDPEVILALNNLKMSSTITATTPPKPQVRNRAKSTTGVVTAATFNFKNNSMRMPPSTDASKRPASKSFVGGARPSLHLHIHPLTTPTKNSKTEPSSPAGSGPSSWSAHHAAKLFPLTGLGALTFTPSTKIAAKSLGSEPGSRPKSRRSASTSSRKAVITRPPPPQWPDFYRFRPTSHFISPHSWMNDPCAQSYDPQTGTFHLMYQWNPSGSEWGNMSWGHATSTDLITWKRNPNEPVLKPEGEDVHPYDFEGIFTGCMVLQGPNGEKDQLSAVYTSVSILPIHHTIPYSRGAESLSIATSKDKGKTWHRIDANPILPGAPADEDITGWRDPFVEPWPAMDRLLGREEGKVLYGCISGGIRHKTPTAFLYTVPRDDLTNWQYEGHLLDLGLHYKSAKLAPDMGVNWEVCNFFSVQTLEGSDEVQFILMNVEAQEEDPERELGPSAEFRQARGPMWARVDMQLDAKGKPALKVIRGSELDHGCLYAASTFFDSRHGRRIMWGWIPDDDIKAERRAAQGWAGCMSLPRELFIWQKRGVVGTFNGTPLRDYGIFDEFPEKDGTTRVRTMAYRPTDEVYGLRVGATKHVFEAQTLQADEDGECKVDLGITSRSWELTTTIHLQADDDLNPASDIGLIVAHDENYEHCTLVHFNLSSSRIYVTREDSTPLDNVNLAPEFGPFPVLRLQGHQKDQDGVHDETHKDVNPAPSHDEETIEPIELRVILDNSVLEIFANNRFALSARIYPTDECTGLSLFAEARTGRPPPKDTPLASFGETRVWEGLRDAYTGEDAYPHVAAEDPAAKI